MKQLGTQFGRDNIRLDFIIELCYCQEPLVRQGSIKQGSTKKVLLLKCFNLAVLVSIELNRELADIISSG